MAELEALYDNQDENLRYGWRYPLPEDKPIRLGRLPAEADWTMNDQRISGFHATIEWDRDRLTVVERGEPKPPKNPIYYKNQPLKKFEVAPGESFVIGHTRFILHARAGQSGENPVDGTIIQREQALTRQDLHGKSFGNPGLTLRALERVPDVLRLATDETLLMREMLKVILEAIPRADSAGVVCLSPDPMTGQVRVGVRDHWQRLGADAESFVPSRKLVNKAMSENRSCLHVWHLDGNDGFASDMTISPNARPGTAPWALCTPFQDGSGMGMYVSGKFPGRAQVTEGSPLDRELTEFQKAAELFVSLLEATRRSHKLERQNALMQQCWPRGTWQYLNDPDELERMLEPRVLEVTVLFCDLRGSSAFAEKGQGELLKTWRDLANALDEMSRAITDEGGVVAGFQGDAVMGFWGWPEPTPNQVEQAARAALKIQERIAGWVQYVKCGMGLAHGPAVAGRLGANDLAKLDVYGPTVNLASRLETMTKAFEIGIMVNEEVQKRLHAADPRGARFRTRKLARVQPRGMKESFLVSELVPTTPKLRPISPNHVQFFEGALNQFHNKQWPQAYQQLQSYLAMDGPAKALMRFMDRKNRSVPDEWDGVVPAEEIPPPADAK